MVKKYVLAATIIARLLDAQNAYAPTQSAFNARFLPKSNLEGITTNVFGEEYTREQEDFEKTAQKIVQEKKEEEFLKLLYLEFPYSEEVGKIVKHAKIFRLEPELLMAIRLAENGKDSLAYGVMHNGKNRERYENDKGYVDNGKFYPYQDEKEKQLHWAAQIVRRYKDEFDKKPKNKDFISYLASIYAPIGASNDPTGLNKNWEVNVKHYYNTFKK